MNYAGWQRRLCEPGRNELRRAEVGGREGVGGKEKTSAPPFPVATQRIYLETGVSMPVVASDGLFFSDGSSTLPRGQALDPI
jgi:hypothetical protein